MTTTPKTAEPKVPFIQFFARAFSISALEEIAVHCERVQKLDLGESMTTEEVILFKALAHNLRAVMALAMPPELRETLPPLVEGQNLEAVAKGGPMSRGVDTSTPPARFPSRSAAYDADGNDSPAPDDDLLEIPGFLRRAAKGSAS